jgi:tRNA A-37 threonylcarbamoyl transferase component Bud32
MTEVDVVPAADVRGAGPSPTVADDPRAGFLRRLEQAAAPLAGDPVEGAPALDDARREALAAQIDRLRAAGSLRADFSVLYVGCGDGSALDALRSRFPAASWYGVDGPGTLGRQAGRVYAVDLDDLFQTPPENKRERFDIVILGTGFGAPAGSATSRAPQWADGWLSKYALFTFGVADGTRLENLRERGPVAQLERPRADGQLVCWSGSRRVPGARTGWLDRRFSFSRWVFQNARRHGVRDAVYFAGRLLLAVVDGRLPRTALGDPELRMRYAATLRPTKRIEADTVYVFVFLGEFGFEVLNWQGVVRRFARRLPPSSSIVVGGRRGLQPFYESASQYVEIDDVEAYRASHAAAYFAMAPGESRRHRPPTEAQFRYDLDLRGAIEAHVRSQLEPDGRRVEFVFSSELNAYEDCVFGADPRFYGTRAYHGSIYRSLDLANNEFRRLEPDEEVRAEVEARLGFGLDEPYVFVQSRRRTIGPQSGGSLDATELVAELARRVRVVHLSFDSGRHLDSGSAGVGADGVVEYQASSFREQSCLMAHAQRCLLLTEGDLGSHTYLPPLLGKDAYVVASRAVFERKSAPVDFWNRNVFRFGGQMIPLPSEDLQSPDELERAADMLSRPAAPGPEPLPATKRIVFIIRHAGYVRNVEHVIDRLAAEGHAIHIATGVASKKSHDADVLPRLTARWPNLSHGQIPTASVRRWDDATGFSRFLLDYLRYLDPAYENAPRLRARATRRLPPGLVAAFERSRFLRRPRVLSTIQSVLRAVDRVAPSHLECEEFLSSLAPDLVVFTPLLDYDSDALDFLKSARELGIPTALCVASWDNLSNKGLVQLVPDSVIVWNDVQRDEAIRMHDIPPERIVVTGAHLFDHWFEMRPSCTREEFCRQRGLDPDVPFLLYVCSSGFVAENEVPFVEKWIAAVRGSDSPLARFGILVRPHAGNPAQWERADLSGHPGVVVWPPLGEGPVDEHRKQNYFDSLYHAAGIVGINTSAQLEGGIVGRHVFTILAEEFRETQIGTLHFHYLVNGGLLTTAADLDEHVEQLRRVIVEGDPERDRARDDFIRGFIRPQGLDRAAAPYAVAELARLMAIPVQGRTPTSARIEGARLALTPLAVGIHRYVAWRRRRALQGRGPETGVALIHRRRVRKSLHMTNELKENTLRRRVRFLASRIDGRVRKQLGLPPRPKRWRPWRDKHVEAEIFFDVDPEHGRVVVKRYRPDVPCIAWLNQHLAKHYDASRGMPVAQHEFAALQKLEQYDIAPKPVRLDKDAIVMTYAGEPINSPNGEYVRDPDAQFGAIIDALDRAELRHNDMLPRNVLVDGGKIRLVDFTLSEFDGVGIVDALPEPKWARAGRDRDLLTYRSEFRAQLVHRWRRWKYGIDTRIPSGRRLATRAVTFWEPPRRRLRRIARETYNYHNLGAGIFPEGEEKTPYGSGERYNFDRMYMMVSNYDFTRKSVIDFGCNSGWFTIQAKLLGSGTTIGVDHQAKGEMGKAIEFAQTFEKAHKLGIHFLDRHLEETDLKRLLAKCGLEQVDCVFLLSVLHHIGKTDLLPKSRFFTNLFPLVKDVIFYEDHEFWNDIVDDDGRPIETQGAGYRFGWNEDLSWQHKIGSLERYGPIILDAYRQTWRRDVLLLDRFSEVRFLGFSEKRRPMFAFFK